MSKNATLIFYFCLALSFLLGGAALVMGFYMVSIMMFFSSIITYTVCYVWITQRQDLRLSIRGKPVILPVLIIFVSFLINYKIPAEIKTGGQELVNAVGLLLLSRYRMAIWAMGIVFMVIFVLSASLINKRGAK
ncbi:MAG: hypothetical protein IPM57_04375 [Oligoflexia bacterium]|nr:hypothetical protein [Oligoflexia bacterium]